MTIKRGYVSVPGGQIHFRRAGAGPQTVVLLHQTASSSAMFERFMDLFVDRQGEDGYTLVAIDTPGFGMSYRPAEPYAIAAWSRDVLAAASEMGLDRFHLLGHHTGAAIAARVAADAPERIESLTMIGALAMDRSERERWLQRIRPMEVNDDGSHLGTVWQEVNTIDDDPTAFPPGLELRHREAADKLLAGDRWHEAYEAVFSTDLSEDLVRVRCPTMLLCGTSDVLLPYVERTLDTRAGINYVPLEAGAYILDLAPELILNHYVDFLALKVAA